MKVPDFLIIGGVRCGTTSLYQQMQRHPQVYMPAVKEPGFFIYQGEPAPRDSHIVTSQTAYEALFESAEPGQVAGEASATYLYRGEITAERIRRQVPDVKLIAQLRHPVERAYSHWRMARTVGRESVEDFGEALRLEDERVAAGAHVIFHYRRQSFYDEPVRRFLEVFGPGRVLVTLFDDFTNDPAATLRTMFEFLEIDAGVELRHPDRESFTTRAPRSRTLDRALRYPGATGRAVRRMIPESIKKPLRRSLEGRNRADPVPLDPELRARLVRLFRDDVLRLQETLDRDLGKWLC